MKTQKELRDELILLAAADNVNGNKLIAQEIINNLFKKNPKYKTSILYTMTIEDAPLYAFTSLSNTNFLLNTKIYLAKRLLEK